MFIGPSACFITHLVWIHLLIPLLEFRKQHHGTERLWLFALGHQGETASSSPMLLWSKRTTRRKTPLNCHPCLYVQPFILIPVHTCYVFDAKYKETSEHKFKVVFPKRSTSARLCVTSARLSKVNRSSWEVRCTHTHLSTAVMKPSENNQLFHSWAVKKKSWRKVWGHKMYELFQAPLSSETNQTSERFLLLLCKPPAQVH